MPTGRYSPGDRRPQPRVNFLERRQREVVSQKTLLGTPLKKVYSLPSGEYNIRSNLRSCQLAEETHRAPAQKGQRGHSEKMLRLSAGSEGQREITTN